MGFCLIVLYVGIISGMIALCGLAGCLYFRSYPASCWSEPVILVTVVRVALWLFQGSVVMLTALQVIRVLSVKV
jgi:hypothetical protein